MYYEAGPRITEPLRSSKESIEKTLDGYCAYRRREGIRESTLAGHRGYIRQYLVWWYSAHDDERTALKNDILAYRTEVMQQRSYKMRTVNAKIIAIQEYYRYLVHKGEMLKNPVTKACKYKSYMVLVQNVLTIEQMKTLLRGIPLVTHYDYLFKSVCEVMYSSGLRISECLSLKEDGIDRERGYIRIYEIKTSRERTVPIDEGALLWLSRYMIKARHSQVKETDRKKGYIYPQYKNADARITRRLQRECLRCGVPKVTSHCFRHSCATHMLQKGAGIKQVQEFLGHASIRNTQIYTHIMKEDLKKVVLQYHPRGKLWEKT